MTATAQPRHRLIFTCAETAREIPIVSDVSRLSPEQRLAERSDAMSDV